MSWVPVTKIQNQYVRAEAWGLGNVFDIPPGVTQLQHWNGSFWGGDQFYLAFYPEHSG